MTIGRIIRLFQTIFFAIAAVLVVNIGQVGAVDLDSVKLLPLYVIRRKQVSIINFIY